MRTEFQSWAWQTLFEEKAESQRSRSSTMCGTACSFLGEECNAFHYDPAASHCRMGKVRPVSLLSLTTLGTESVGSL